MSVRSMKFLPRLVALGLAGLSLTGCVVYPHGGGYAYGYAPSYYEPAYVAPAPVVVFGGGWGGGWGGDHDRGWGDGGGHHWH